MDRVAVIGAGVGGLCAAIDLARNGFAVTVFEAAAGPGGKMRAEVLGVVTLDAGPTVLTLRPVFDALFSDAGASLDDAVTLTPLAVLARHAWGEDQRLDLFADPQHSEEAIGDFAGADAARGFRAFRTRAAEIFDTLDATFMQAQRPTPFSLALAAMPYKLGALMRISPFETLWQALGTYFPDPRLRQLFGRYATYCGSSPFQAPATLMLIAEAEQRGVWSIDGGMAALAQALVALGERLGVTFRYDAPVREIVVGGGAACGVTLDNGEIIDADVIVSNVDSAALANGLFGDGARAAANSDGERSLSAVTLLLHATANGFPLARHSVFFSDDYPAEFAALARNELPVDPTIYVCAQDRGDDAQANGAERLLILANAPANGESHARSDTEIESCRERILSRLHRSGLTISAIEAETITTPADFHRRYPATGGALYGRATHGWAASFRRPGARSALPGLYLTGGSVHPGAGVPMAAISGRLAAQAIVADRASTRRSQRTAMPGGMSTR